MFKLWKKSLEKSRKGKKRRTFIIGLTRPIDERFDIAGQLLELYFELHPETPRGLQKSFRLIDREGNILRSVWERELR